MLKVYRYGPWSLKLQFKNKSITTCTSIPSVSSNFFLSTVLKSSSVFLLYKLPVARKHLDGTLDSLKHQKENSLVVKKCWTLSIKMIFNQHLGSNSTFIHFLNVLFVHTMLIISFKPKMNQPVKQNDRDRLTINIMNILISGLTGLGLLTDC